MLAVRARLIQDFSPESRATKVADPQLALEHVSSPVYRVLRRLGVSVEDQERADEHRVDEDADYQGEAELAERA